MEQKINITPVGDQVVIRTGSATQIFKYNGFQYEAYSTDSFIRMVDAKAIQSNAVVAYDDTGMKAILDDTVIDREQDRVRYDFLKSLQYQEFKQILEGCRMNQKEFIKFLQRREPDEIKDIEKLLYDLMNFKYVTNIEGDFSQADNNNYTFMIKTKEGEGTVKIPQVINAKIEVFNDSGFFQGMEIEIEVYKPKDPGESPGFELKCPKLSRYLKAAVEHEIETLKKGLPDYLIITGSI